MKIFTLLLFTGLVYFLKVNSQPIIESCVCPALYLPVCGSDGNIYGNPCLLNCENIRRMKLGLPPIFSLGQCTETPPSEDPCACPKIYRPVCGSDGKIYDNECLLNCENSKRAKLGLPQIFNLGECTEAPPSVDPCACPKIYRPVCGSDGKVYDNECLLNCENSKRVKLGLPQIFKLGECTLPSDSCNCPKIYNPVCGSDGKIYDNECLLNCENERRQKLGLPQICVISKVTTPKPEEECICPAVYKPVCGSDGKIYDNECLLNCENKRRLALGLPQIWIVDSGLPPKPQEECICPAIYKPVCGSDGKIYDNECLLNCENKRRVALGLPQISIVSPHVGLPLQPQEVYVCQTVRNPVYYY